MKIKSLRIISVVGLLISFVNVAYSQLNCAEAAATRLPWRQRAEAQTGNWAGALRPVHAEMQRLFPQPPAGLEITYGIFDAMGIKTAPLNSIQYFEGFYMIKDIVCERRNGDQRSIVPEGETGCWIYFRVNDFNNFLANNASGTKMTIPGTELRLYTAADLRIVESKNGISGVYFFNDRDEQTLAGWYFSASKTLPYRRLSKAELAAAYRAYWTVKFDEEIKRLENVLVTSQKTAARVAAEKGTMSEKEKEEFFRSLRDGDRSTQQSIDRFKVQRADVIARTDAMSKAPDAGSDARISNLNDLVYEPSGLDAKGGKGRFVYVENRAIFDPRLPKWQPQFITAELRRQDTSPAKTSFVKRFEDEFDWNVVRKIVGLAPRPSPSTISGIGSTPGEYTTGRIENKPAERTGILFEEDFSAARTGEAPPKWTLSSPGIVRSDIGAPGKWLTIKEPGLYFPDYSVLVQPNDFTLEFEVMWSKSISYYSPNFVFHLGAAAYDNTLKRYDRAQVNPNAYTSAQMPRVAIWIDPYWNDFGRYGLQVFDARGGYVRDRTEKTPIFFREKNSIRVKLVRKGQMLSVYFNDVKMFDDAVLGEETRWNFFGFGLTDAPNALPGDEFYVGNIRLSR